MKMKGFQNFRQKIPLLKGKRIILFPVFIIAIILGLIALIWDIYQWPTSMNEWSVIFPLFGIGMLEVIGLILVFQIWFWKEDLRESFPKTAYQRIIFVGFSGIIIMILLAFNNLTPIRCIEPKVWANPIFSYFGQPLTFFMEKNKIFVDICRYSLGIAIFLIGLLTMWRSLLTFGFDYMALVYLYYPEESKVQNYKIYSILRHPAYTGIIMICFSGFILHLSVFHFLYFALYTALFCIHIFLVEEKELIQRFGGSYKEYQKSTPALLVRPKDWNIFFQFLLRKSNSEE